MPDKSAVIGFTGTWNGAHFIFDPQNSTTDPKPSDPTPTTPEPSFFAKIWNFILKWLFFGWIWMK